LLAFCWQSVLIEDPQMPFVLVGLTGFEPVASAV
jgi:hypothetical protein